jgi:hypothetical protein
MIEVIVEYVNWKTGNRVICRVPAKPLPYKFGR